MLSVFLAGCKMTIKYRPRCFLDVDIDSKPGKAYAGIIYYAVVYDTVFVLVCCLVLL